MAGANEAREQSLAYLEQAGSCTAPHRGALLITCGVSGSGKTHYSRGLSRRLGAVHLRSDIERKRLFGLKPLQPSDGLDIYTTEASDRTFARLRELAGLLLDAGYSVIVDATFIERARRDDFRRLADAQRVPFQILLFDPSPETLRQRVRQRLQSADDASEADLEVLESQLRHFDRPGDDEGEYLCIRNNEHGDDIGTISEEYPPNLI